MLISSGPLVRRLICGTALLLRAGFDPCSGLLVEEPPCPESCSCPLHSRVPVADAHDVQVMVRHEILLFFVKVYIAAREDHEIVLPIIGQPGLPHTERRHHPLEGALTNDALLLLELAY